ncbi:MAG: hypothetical protein J6Y85_05305 [Alphaproteobacteria bacterium]|nr:hypothetical protein [Alphaproteobacteria bacterium]
MKKYSLILGISLMLSQTALAETTIEWTQAGCQSVGGTWITAKNGTNFCRGPVQTNWFNALIFCKSIGHNLVSFEHLCPGISVAPNSAKGACANANNIGNVWVWTGMPWSTNQALHVDLSNGRVYADYGAGSGATRNTVAFYALCEE